MNYAVRLTFPASRLTPWFARVAMASEKVVVYEHDGDPNNIHCHALLMGVRPDKTTLKNWVKETLNLKPARTQWVFAEQAKDGGPITEDFIAYMSKGKHEPKYVKGFTPDQIAAYKAKGYDGKHTDEKPDKNTAYYQGFITWVDDECETEMFKKLTEKGKFEKIKRLSYCYMMNNVKLPMPHDLARHKACVMRLAWDYDIPLPPDEKSYRM